VTPEEFAQECRDASRALRRVPSALRRELSAGMREEIADPLAARIRSAGRGVYSSRVAPTAKGRASADPKVVVGGARRVASGGATARDLVFGAEFGGGSRITPVRASNRNRSHARRTTRQFLRNRSPFVYPTVGASVGWSLDAFANVVTRILTQEVDNG
jgi:hypothetical protein